MNKIKSFSIYDNYYKLFKWLPKEEKEKVSLAVFEYVFEDKEPSQLNEQGLDAWDNLKRLLDTSKKQSLIALRRWEQNDAKEDATNNAKSNAKSNANDDAKEDANNIYLISNLIINNLFIKNKGLLREKIEEWVSYKKERKDKEYTEIGFKRLLSQIENNVNKYGEENVIELIDNCMASNYKGIVFDKLKHQRTQKNKVPNWNENEILSSEATIEEQEKMNKMLEEFK